MDDVREDLLGPPHGTTLAAVILNKIILRYFKSSEQEMGHTALSAT